MLTETLTWRAVADGLPDDGIAVLVTTRNCEEPVWLGFLDGEQWRDVDATEIEVTHWADIPKGAPDGERGAVSPSCAATDQQEPE